MAEITGLVLPFFGLILLGYIAARITRQPQEAMGWLNTFIIYVSLPALFFKLLSRDADRTAGALGLCADQHGGDLHRVRAGVCRKHPDPPRD
jgi:predicted permease